MKLLPTESTGLGIVVNNSTHFSIAAPPSPKESVVCMSIAESVRDAQIEVISCLLLMM